MKYALTGAALGVMLSVAMTGAAAISAAAADIKPAVVFDMGGKFDKSFNEGVYDGVEQFKKETGIGYVDFEITNETQFEQAHRRFAERGQDPIIGVGFSQADAVEKVAKEFPKIAVHHHRQRGQPAQRAVGGVQGAGGLVPGRHAGGAWRRKSGKVGFVGGMDIPLIRRFECGYEQGVEVRQSQGRGDRRT